MWEAIAAGDLSTGGIVLLFVSLLVALGFEFVNGFHDTANAVATVIYTNTLRPIVAVIYSGICNFIGVFAGGIAVALSIVHLLPVALLVEGGASHGIAMVLALLLAAILWNLGTWYLGLPASSSHTLIGAILGVGFANSAVRGQFGEGVNTSKVIDVFSALLVSPLIGFGVAALLVWTARKLIKDKRFFQSPKGSEAPPLPIRALLILTCGGVSLAHGSNDGQKGVGLLMLVLTGMLPAAFALNEAATPTDMRVTLGAAQRMELILTDAGVQCEGADARPACALRSHLTRLQATLGEHETAAAIPRAERWSVREDILRVDEALEGAKAELGETVTDRLKDERDKLATMTEYAPTWVIFMVALAIGIGTTIGWKRIVITVGEKIGKAHLTYAQGASAELVAMSTIGLSAFLGLPVSTTHVLSSGIAGTMAIERAGLNGKTVRNIALAWVLTLPVTMLLSGGLFLLFRTFI